VFYNAALRALVEKLGFVMKICSQTTRRVGDDWRNEMLCAHLALKTCFSPQNASEPSPFAQSARRSDPATRGPQASLLPGHMLQRMDSAPEFVMGSRLWASPASAFWRTRRGFGEKAWE
jgi:hypothetical protein